MKKYKSILFKLMAVTSIGLLGIGFQNCGQSPDADSTELSSETILDTEVIAPEIPEHDGNSDGHQFMERKAESTLYNFVVMNKHQIMSQLNYVFGPTTPATLDIQKTLAAQYAHFGGICNLHDNVLYLNAAGKLATEGSDLFECDRAASLNTPATPPMGSTRSALFDKICGRAITDPETVYHALLKVDAKNNTMFLNSVDAGSHNKAISTAFRLFYPTQPDPMVVAPNLIESLRFFFADPTKPTLPEWQAVLYTLCISPYWQVL